MKRHRIRSSSIILISSALLYILFIVGCAEPQVVIKTQKVNVPVKSLVSKEIYDYALEPPLFYKDNEAKTINSLHEKYLRLRKVFINTVTYYEITQEAK